MQKKCFTISVSTNLANRYYFQGPSQGLNTRLLDKIDVEMWSPYHIPSFHNSQIISSCQLLRGLPQVQGAAVPKVTTQAQYQGLKSLTQFLSWGLSHWLEDGRLLTVSSLGLSSLFKHPSISLQISSSYKDTVILYYSPPNLA